MNPIHQIATLLGMKKRERKCQKCGHTQHVAERQVKDVVPCARCGTLVPPRASR